VSAPGPMPPVEHLDSVADARPAPPPRGGVLELLAVARDLQATQANAAAALELIVSKARELLQADLAWGGTVEAGLMQLRCVSGARTEALLSVCEEQTPLGMALSGAALERQRTLIIGDYPSFTYRTTPTIRRGMRAERVASMMVAPMYRREKLVGYVNVASRRPTAFGAAHGSLLSTLAAQGSVAILNASLQEELRSRNELLADSLTVQHDLTATTLQSTGIDGLIEKLERQLGRTIEYVGDGDASDGRVGIRVPVLAAGNRLGWLLVEGGPPAPLELHALNHGAAALALELLSLRATRDAEQRMRGRLLEDMVHSGSRTEASIEQRLEQLGHDPAIPHRIVALEAKGSAAAGASSAIREMLERQAAAAGRPIPLTHLSGTALVAALGPDWDPAAIHARLLDDSLPTDIGVSRAGFDLLAARSEALGCLALARRAELPALIDATRLGPLRFILDAPDGQVLDDLVSDRLRVLADADHESSAPLLATTREFVRLDGARRETAEACAIHVNTLKYRLSRIEEALGYSLSDPDRRFEMRLAFDVYDVLVDLGIDSAAASDSTARAARWSTAARASPAPGPPTVGSASQRL
jgi:hypothetical protein